MAKSPIAYPASGTPTTVGTTWANTANAIGAPNAAFASWTSTASGATGSLTEPTTFGLQAAVGSAPQSIESIDVTVKGYVTNTSRVTGYTVQLLKNGVAVGSPVALTRTTTTTNVETVNILASAIGGLTWADLPTLSARVTFTRGAVTQAGNGMLDSVGIEVNYTPVPPAQATVKVRNGVDGAFVDRPVFRRNGVDGPFVPVSAGGITVLGPR